MRRLRTAGIVVSLVGALAGGCKRKLPEEQVCQPYYDNGYAAGLAECEKPEEQAQPEEDQPEENPNRIVRIDEETGARIVMDYRICSIEKGDMYFRTKGISGPTIRYLNSAGKRIGISADLPKNYDELPACGFYLYILVDEIYITAHDDEALCKAAGKKYMEICKELKCIETTQEWREYTKNLWNSITPERLE